MAPRVSPDHLENRRREILAAAWRCFGRKGFHQTTMRDICREAGLSPGAVYQYFQGKDDLIRAVAEEGRRASAARAAPATESRSPPDALAETLTRFLDCLDDPNAIPSLRIDIRLCAEALHEAQVRQAVLENYQSLLDLFTPVIERGQELGALDRAHTPEAVARILVAIFQGLEFQKALDPDVDVKASASAAAALLRGTFARPDPDSNEP